MNYNTLNKSYYIIGLACILRILFYEKLWIQWVSDWIVSIWYIDNKKFLNTQALWTNSIVRWWSLIRYLSKLLNSMNKIQNGIQRENVFQFILGRFIPRNSIFETSSFFLQKKTRSFSHCKLCKVNHSNQK